MRILFLTYARSYAIKELVASLTKNDIGCRVFNDPDLDLDKKFPSRYIRMWFNHDKQLKKLLDEFKPDYFYIEHFLYGHTSILNLGVPLLIYLRGDIWAEGSVNPYPIPFHKAHQWVRHRGRMSVLKRSSVIFAVSDYLRDIVNERYPDKAMTLYHGIDPTKWQLTKGGGMKLKHPCVGLVQRAISIDKTQEMLTLAKVLESMPDVTFYWAGDGPHQNMVLDVLGKYDNFEHLGRLEHPDGVREFLSEIDVYTLITGMDTFGVSLQEAQLMQRPVIATDIGGTPEAMQDGKTGFLVERGNADQIIEKIRYLLDSPEKAKEMGQAGRRFVEENFNWDKIARDLIRVLESRA